MRIRFFPTVLVVAVLSVFCWTVGLRAAPPPTYAGGDGSTQEKAVVIKGGTEETGVAAEYTYLDQHFPGNKRNGQGVFSAGKKQYDRLEFTTTKGEKKTLFFDITGFYGKF